MTHAEKFLNFIKENGGADYDTIYLHFRKRGARSNIITILDCALQRNIELGLLRYDGRRYIAREGGRRGQAA